MSEIYLETFIEAPAERVFDLSRSIDFHKFSVKETHEEAIAGKISGLIGLDEYVTWRAKHLGVFQILTVKITQFNSPFSFTDEMTKGPFKSMKHIHEFKSIQTGTLMTDHFFFESPLGIAGKFVNILFLENYMKKFLLIRNKSLKEVVETDKWKEILRSTI